MIIIKDLNSIITVKVNEENILRMNFINEYGIEDRFVFETLTTKYALYFVGVEGLCGYQNGILLNEFKNNIDKAFIDRSYETTEFILMEHIQLTIEDRQKEIK